MAHPPSASHHSLPSPLTPPPPPPPSPALPPLPSAFLPHRSLVRHSLSSASPPLRFFPRTTTSLGLPPIDALQRRAAGESGKVGKLGSSDLPSLKGSEASWGGGAGKAWKEYDESDPVWEQIGAGLRITYAAGVYAVMAIAGQGICHFTGLDNTGGFELCPDVAMQGLGFAVLPMMASLFILDDEVVRVSPAARAIRDVEDEELLSFFVGMSPWQLMLVVMMDAVAEELFFRIAIQGGLAHIFLSDDTIHAPCPGVAALTGVFPSIAPFAHAVAAVLTACLTGSILFITSFPQDPAYVITRVQRNGSSPIELKRSFSAWYERRQMRRIYSPLLDSLLALYLGVEWLQTGNILAPIVTHMIYSTVIMGNGLRRIHEQREKLRLRTRRFWQKKLNLSSLTSNTEEYK